MELSLVRSLMDKEFYDEHRGARCPTDCSVKMYARSNKQWMTQWTGTDVQLHLTEIEALFMANNPTLTTAQKQAYSHLFHTDKERHTYG